MFSRMKFSRKIFWSIFGTAAGSALVICFLLYGTMASVTQDIEVFKMSSTGTLSSQQVFHLDTIPLNMTIAGSVIYVTNLGDGNISTFRIQMDGRLQSLASPVPAGCQPETVAIDPLGKFAYALDFVSDEILPYTVMPMASLFQWLGVRFTQDQCHLKLW